MREMRQIAKNRVINERKSSKRLRKTLGVLILILLPLTTIKAWNIGVNFLVNNQSEEIIELNRLLIDLDEEPIETARFTSTSPLTLIDRTREYFELKNKLNSKEELETRKQEIIDNFNAVVNEYSSKILEFNELNLSFLPSNIDDIDFYTKKNPDLYLDTLKSQFKAAIVTYNQGSDTNLYWELNPEVEVSEMTEQEKLGQLVSFPISGLTLSELDRQFLEDYNIGSITYFGENISDQNQVTSLSFSVQNLDDRFPNLIAVDQEGGNVERIWWDPVGSHKEIASMDEQGQCDSWEARSELLRGLGINWNLGIVADVTQDPGSFIYPRTFSNDYMAAGYSVEKAVLCSSKNLSTLKHWPGHGATTVDTHKQLGRLSSNSEEEWKQSDYLPFSSGMSAGADSVMVGHLIVPWIDNENPCTLSTNCISYLRESVGYNGLIVTDDMSMLKSSGYSLSDVTKQALMSGNDFLFIVTTDDFERRNVMDNLLTTIENGELSEGDLDLKVIRVLNAKNKIITTSERFIPADLVY